MTELIDNLKVFIALLVYGGIAVWALAVAWERRKQHKLTKKDDHPSHKDST